MIRDLDLENKIIWSMSALIGLLIILAFSVASHNDSLANDKEWNNGYCLECEEQYQYIDSITESVLFFQKPSISTNVLSAINI